MKTKLFTAFSILLLFLAIFAFAFDTSSILSWQILEGNVAKVSVGDRVIWPPNTWSFFYFDDGCIISTNISSIEPSQFYTNNSLKKVELGTNVTTIGPSAFRGCSNLEEIVFSENVNSIGTYVFFECTSLKNIDFPRKEYKISGRVFYGCSSLTNINIPETITDLGNRAVANCPNLTAVEIIGVKNISEYAFSNNGGLTEITLGADISSIGSNAFRTCNNLQTFKFYKKDNETASEAEERIKTLISNSGFSITGKTFTCLNP